MITIRTVSGRVIDLAATHPADIDVRDIAQGLSHCCRFAGQLPQFYSVAQHAVLVSSIVDPPLRFHALHHDDSEAYMGDLSRNLKHSPGLEGYRLLEAKMEGVIAQALGLEPLSDGAKRQIKAADDLAAIFERAMVREQRPFVPSYDIQRAIQDGFVKTPIEELHRLSLRLTSHEFLREFTCASPERARLVFLRVHERLKKERQPVCPRCDGFLTVDAGFFCTTVHCACGYGNSDMGFSL